jgi:hypothetical protein
MDQRDRATASVQPLTERDARGHYKVPFRQTASPGQQEAPEIDVQLLAWAVGNCHMLARRRLRAGSADAEWWSHVLRICEKAGAQSAGVLRAALPTEITDGSQPLPSAVPAPSEREILDRVVAYIEGALRPGVKNAICANAYERGRFSGLREALNTITAERAALSRAESQP